VIEMDRQRQLIWCWRWCESKSSMLFVFI